MVVALAIELAPGKVGRTLAAEPEKSRNSAPALQLRPDEFPVQHPIEWRWQVVPKSLGDAGLQLIERDLRDGRQILALRLGNRQPDQLDQLTVGADLAIHLVGDRARVRGKEAGIEAARAARGRD